jgi:DNA-binding NtrC family response regulator
LSTPLRVLIVDDQEDDALLVLRELRRANYDPTYEWVYTEEAMSEALERGGWEIVLCDHGMPKFNSLRALQVLREKGLDLPFIIVSGTIGEDIAVAAMKAGAGDYVMKGNLVRLNPAVERELREAEVRRARRKAEDGELRLHRELEEKHRQLEQRITELTAVNRLFQDHLAQRFAAVQAYRDFLEGLQRLLKEMSALVERAQSQPIPDLQDAPGLDPEVGSTHAE